MIVETVVTTLDPAGRPHFAAMGVVWGDERLTIRPYVATRTYRHLAAARAAVVNVTDDVLAFARSALEHGPLPARPATRVPGVVLADACHWREVEVEAVTVPPAGADGRRRAEIVARVVATGTGRPFVGLCRAKHAVVEASIVASRVRWLGPASALAEVDRLQGLVDRTGGPQEHAAMDLIRAHVRARAARCPS